MPPHRTTHPPAALPSRHIFDPWNSSSTGHQRPDGNRLAGSPSWRASRTKKLGQQFLESSRGMKNVDEVLGAASAGGIQKGQKDMDMDKMSNTLPTCSEAGHAVVKKETKGLFAGLCVYVNGSTAPVVGDHRLKSLLAEHGARVSVHLGRKSVTHVVLGRANEGPGCGRGAGGGLAAGKLQREIGRVGGCGVRFVGVEWFVYCSYISLPIFFSFSFLSLIPIFVSFFGGNVICDL